jgi:hypothetical protein
MKVWATAVTLVGASIALSVTGCGESKAAILAQCRLDAMKTYPAKSPYGDEVRTFVILCMEAKGYSPTSLASCVDRGTLQEGCYQSSREYWWAWLLNAK